MEEKTHESTHLALLLALVMVASLFAACSAGKTGTPDASTGTSQTPDDSKTTEDTKPAKTEKTKIVYWHSYTDQHEEKFLELAAAFNASQDEYELVASSSRTARSTARPCRPSATARARTL